MIHRYANSSPVAMACLAALAFYLQSPCILAATNDAKTLTRPHWIWNSTGERAGQTARLHTTFTVNDGLESATLHLAADFCSCRVSINQTHLMQLDAYAPWLQRDVTDELTVGQNQLHVDCQSTRGPAAIAVSLHLTYADGSRATVITDQGWQTANGTTTSFGSVAEELWDVENVARISPFEDYEQWRRATGADKGTDPATFVTRAGFEVDLIRSATPDEGSWVSMAIDPQGRIIVAREDQGLLRMTLSQDGNEIQHVETINDNLKECRGLLFAYDSLYVNANNSKGFYRLRDSDGDDTFDNVELLRTFPGSVGHGRNDLTLGPDGMIYSIHGDSVDLPDQNILDRTSPLRRARNGVKTHEGHLIRTDQDGQHWELVASGLRNPFGVDFTQWGEAFTYDADNEYDMGSPWYRPTRLVQLVSGGDYGWRRMTNGEWPPYYPDHADNGLPTVDVGKGSPTAVKSGGKSSFPPHYQRAVFALDWAYGRILACHLTPRGAGFACRVESFLAGRPLNVTDLDFGPDGNMYLVTGGRKTKSALYRIRYTAPDSIEPSESKQFARRERYSQQERELRRKLSQSHQESATTAAHGKINSLEAAWNHLDHPDPLIRNAARISVEHRPIQEWRDRALAEPNPERAATAILALARARSPIDRQPILARLDSSPVDKLSAFAKLSLLHTYRIVLGLEASSDSAQPAGSSGTRLLSWLRSESELAIAPLGSGYSVHHELARIVADLQVDGAVDPLLSLLRNADSQRDRMNVLYMLCHQQSGWTVGGRVLFFEALGELERTAFSGAGMPGRLQQIRERATANLSDDEKEALSDLLEPESINEGPAKTVSRPFVRKWNVETLTSELVGLSDGAAKSGNSKLGEALFRDVLCASCHRIEGRGGVLGPDLTSLASRFSKRDILVSIIRPSDVIAEKYRGSQIVTTDGTVIVGQVQTGGDYRSSTLRISTDPLDPSEVVEVAKQDVELHQPSKVSPMPEGLLDTLTAQEVAHLLAYLTDRK